MTVAELMQSLHGFDPNTEVGVALSRRTGWVQGIARITTDEKGRAIIDQAEETLDTEEVRIGEGPEQGPEQGPEDIAKETPEYP